MSFLHLNFMCAFGLFLALDFIATAARTQVTYPHWLTNTPSTGVYNKFICDRKYFLFRFFCDESILLRWTRNLSDENNCNAITKITTIVRVHFAFL